MTSNKERLLSYIIILNIIFLTGLAHAGPVEIPSLFYSLPADRNQHAEWFEKGKILYNLRAYPEAAAAFSRMDRNAPQDIMDESLYLKANSLMQAGDYSEALSVVNLIPENSRFYPFGLYTRAMIYLHKGREQEALTYLGLISGNFPLTQNIKDRQARLIENLALRAHITLGFIYLENNNHRMAVKHFAVIPEGSPYHRQALFGIGWAYARMERWVRSVVFWEELVYLYPESTYAIEATPYIGYAYTILSAYGKAIEQNGIALKYYEGLLQKVTDIRKEIQQKDVKRIAYAIEFINDEKSAGKFEVYHGLLSMEEYLKKHYGSGKIAEVEALTELSRESREGIIDSISNRLDKELESLRHRLLETASETTLELAGNLRLEGGGQISSDMVFDAP